MQRNGWTLLFHDCLIAQLQKLATATARAKAQDPDGYGTNANVKLFNALAQLMLETIPSNPGRDEFRQGNTMGPVFRHWRRAKIGRRFRLFFRFDSKSKIIIFAWINDEHSLRASGSSTDPYAVFCKMLQRGHPPNGWEDLLQASQAEWPVDRIS